MSMNNDDIENNYPREEEPSRNAIGENQMQTSEHTDEVQARDQYLSKKTYDSIKHNRGIGDDILRQKSPMGNTVLHIAALYGNDNCVEKITQNASHSHLLAEKNDNDDTALHAAARAGHVSTLEKLWAARLHNLLPHPNYENTSVSLDEILVKNRQGNTFFHEAFLNGHKDVMKILDSPELLQIEAGLRELVEQAAFSWTNNEKKSVLHLAIEKGFEDIVDHALTKLTSQQLDTLMSLRAIPEGKPRPNLADLDGDMDTGDFDFDDDSPVETDHETRTRPPATSHSSAILESNFAKFKCKTLAIPKLISEDDGDESQYELQRVEEEGLITQSAFNADIKMKAHKKSGLSKYELHQELCQPSTIDKEIDVLQGKSPLIVAILKRDQGILRIILTKRKEWIHLRDNKRRTALHYAASIGYLNGVEYLLGNCVSCNMERDIQGFSPLHLASAGGHTEVVKILLQHEHCPDPREILDNYGRNIVHIAAQMGRFNVVRYMLQDAIHGLVDMINDKDEDGNTPLHLAASHWHPKIVQALTWDKRVDLSLVNEENETALDACMKFQQENPTLRQRLTWSQLKSAGAKKAKRGQDPIEVPSPNMDLYKDRINTLLLVSTLITTVTFAAGFTLPGGTNSSDPGKGMAVMLNHVWFKLFVFCITISMYGAISVTIILIWAQLGDITLALLALKVAMPLLGVTLATLSVAFFAGVHLVISDLSWLATTILVLCVIFILVLLLLYTLLLFPSESNNLVMRYISYYPFLFLTWVAERDATEDNMK